MISSALNQFKYKLFQLFCLAKKIIKHALLHCLSCNQLQLLTAIPEKYFTIFEIHNKLSCLRIVYLLLLFPSDRKYG
jgi:hypothetical protein